MNKKNNQQRWFIGTLASLGAAAFCGLHCLNNKGLKAIGSAFNAVLESYSTENTPLTD